MQKSKAKLCLFNPSPPRVSHASRKIFSAMVAPTKYAGIWVLPSGLTGKIDASATLNPVTPNTRPLESTTALAAADVPMRHVPNQWWEGV